MSQLPPEYPYEITYETPSPQGNAPTLVRLAGIFNLIAAGIDLLYGLGMVALGGFTAYVALHDPPRPGSAMTPTAVAWVAGAMYGGPGLLSLLGLFPKLVGGVKLLRRSPGAWKWGLAAGIVGAVSIWAVMPCCVAVVIPMGAGIYTIIILCLPHVKAYLKTPPPQSQR